MPTQRQTGDTALAPGNGVCNDGQGVFEQTVNEGSVPVYVDGETRNVTKGATGNAVPLVANATQTPGGGAGVVMPWGDKAGRFETPGKA